MIEIILMAGPASSEGGSAPNPLLSMLPFVLIFVLFYVLFIIPKQKEQKKHQQMLQSLKKGDRVLTSGGMYGTVIGVKENIVVLKIAENVKAEFQMSSVQGVMTKELEQAQSKK
jgi:preprotein translocase subunit YajC